MTRTILGVIFAAALSLPCIASAMPNEKNVTPAQTQNTQSQHMRQSSRATTTTPTNDTNTLGNGNSAESNGDVTGPGAKARIDTSTKGPLNDVQPGRGSEDVPRSANPR